MGGRKEPPEFTIATNTRTTVCPMVYFNNGRYAIVQTLEFVGGDKSSADKWTCGSYTEL